MSGLPGYYWVVQCPHCPSSRTIKPEFITIQKRGKIKLDDWFLGLDRELLNAGRMGFWVQFVACLNI